MIVSMKRFSPQITGPIAQDLQQGNFAKVFANTAMWPAVTQIIDDRTVSINQLKRIAEQCAKRGGKEDVEALARFFEGKGWHVSASEVRQVAAGMQMGLPEDAGGL